MQLRWKEIFLYILFLSNSISGIIINRISKNETGISTSDDYFEKEKTTRLFCSRHRADCENLYMGYLCSSCKCHEKTNFFSKTEGCLDFNELQNKIQSTMGYKCIYGINALKDDRPEQEVPSFSKKLWIAKGYELQSFNTMSLDISRLAVNCVIKNLYHLTHSGLPEPFFANQNASVFEVITSSKGSSGFGFKEVNIKLLKFIGTESEWNAMKGKLLLLSIECSDQREQPEKSCFVYSINGTETTDPSPTLTITPKLTATSVTMTGANVTPFGQEKQKTNGTRIDTPINESPHFIPIIIGIAVSLTIIVIVVCSLFFIKRKGKHRRHRKGRSLQDSESLNEKAKTLSDEYVYADPDRVLVKEKKGKKRTVANSDNPLYRPADAPERVNESENVLYESEEPPVSKDKKSANYQALSKADKPFIYDKCSPKVDSLDQPSHDYAEYSVADAQRYQVLGGLDDPSEYKGLYSTPEDHEESLDEKPVQVSDDYSEACQDPESPVYRELYPEWPQP